MRLIATFSLLTGILLSPCLARPSTGLVSRQTSLPSGWSSLGCYTDSTSSRTLQTASFTSVQSMTISSCISFCSQGNYKYAGLEFARECYCDNAIHSPGSLAALADCNMACTGDSTTFCGGADRISIFISNAGGQTPTSTSTTPTSTSTITTSTVVVAPTSPAIKKNVGTWQYKGCYQDFGPRILVHQITLSGVTAEICTSACKSRGYGLAGLEFGDECWCDNYLPFGQLQADTDCNMPCAGDGSELCGAGNRMVLYQDSSATPVSQGTCLETRDFYSFGIISVDKQTGLNPLQMYITTPVVTHGDTGPEYSIWAHCNDCPWDNYYNFDMDGTVPGVISVPETSGKSAAPRVGESPMTVAFTTEAPYSGYCPMPNPVSPNGPFIGSPILAAGGRPDLFSLCSNTTANGRLDVVYSPIDNHPHYVKANCESIYLTLSPWYDNPHGL